MLINAFEIKHNMVLNHTSHQKTAVNMLVEDLLPLILVGIWEMS